MGITEVSSLVRPVPNLDALFEGLSTDVEFIALLALFDPSVQGYLRKHHDAFKLQSFYR